MAKPRPLPSVDEQGHLLGAYDVLLRSPQVGQLLGAFGSGLRGATHVPRRLLEVAVLVTVAHWRCEMLWAAHEPQARAEGISDEVIAAIRYGRRPQFSQTEGREIYDLALDLVTTGRLSQSSFEKGRRLLQIKGLVEVVLLVGNYCTQSFVLNAGQVPPLGNSGPVWPK